DDARFDGAKFSGGALFGGVKFGGEAQFIGATFSDDARFDGAKFSGGALFGGVKFGGEAQFIGATFGGGARFGGVKFSGDALFGGAAFGAGARFSKATFAGGALFDGATFSGASFVGAAFGGDAQFVGAKFSGGARFDGATFSDASFVVAKFGGGARFNRARFGGDAQFRRAAFSGDVRFGEATFVGEARFGRAAFSGDVRFGEATFGGEARFGGVTFAGGALFGGATFSDASFGGATFSDASFGGAAFSGDARFDEAKFSGGARFDGATFSGEASFVESTFEMAESFGPVVGRTLTLSRATFSKWVVVQVSAADLSCDETRFESGAELQLSNANAAFRRTVFTAPSVIANAVQPPTEHAATAEQEMGLGQRPPALISLEGVDVTDLVVTDIDLSCCRFAGAHHLDKLRLEGDCQFAWPPKGVQRGWAWLPVWRWTRRQVLAEERDRRAVSPKNLGWQTGSPPVPSSDTPLNAKRVAALYRDLRKAQEDSKNEPGAADFYYGEMEMRRTDRATAWPERLILFLYWLVSGYGLRMTRALSCLVTLIATASVTLHLIGFAPPQPPQTPPSLSTCLLYAAESAVSLDPKLAGLPNLTWQGEVVRVAMRLLGPLLLGLALLAIRNRVKR
ncbi:pentapeptide repeat-containing protein, partial [Saccharopolyspora shandongensis]|uniref:pentapeptide repeat-containing protein n=1 Tax=Saccharopolyspora shandongensis TaxID=418495 RepID=UPI0034220FAC